MPLVPDKNIIQEHKFYDSGNIKHLLPLIKLQNYEQNIETDPGYDYSYITVFIFLVLLMVYITFKKAPRSKRDEKFSMA